jgi:hypothetical protein
MRFSHLHPGRGGVPNTRGPMACEVPRLSLPILATNTPQKFPRGTFHPSPSVLSVTSQHAGCAIPPPQQWPLSHASDGSRWIRPGTRFGMVGIGITRLGCCTFCLFWSATSTMETNHSSGPARRCTDASASFTCMQSLFLAGNSAGPAVQRTGTAPTAISI